MRGVQFIGKGVLFCIGHRHSPRICTSARKMTFWAKELLIVLIFERSSFVRIFEIVGTREKECTERGKIEFGENQRKCEEIYLGRTERTNCNLL